MNRIPHWTERWNELETHLASRPRLLVATDFDGTLAPIVPHPEDARLPGATRGLMRRIAACDDILFAVISGRELEDVRTRVGLDTLLYAGNHGLEIHAP